MNARRGQDDDDPLRDTELRRREEAVDERGARMQAMGTKIESLETRIANLEATINRYKGALAAIMVGFAVIGYVLTWFKDKLFGQGH